MVEEIGVAETTISGEEWLVLVKFFDGKIHPLEACRFGAQEKVNRDGLPS